MKIQCICRIHKTLLPLIASSIILSGCGQYGTLLNDWKTAAPPALLLNAASVPSVLPESQAPEEQSAANRQHERLRALAAGMLSTLNQNDSSAFFSPSPERYQLFLAAATDEAAAIKALSGGFSLADLLTLTLLRSPVLREAEAVYRATLSRYEQAMALDDLLQRYASFSQGLEPGVGAMSGRTPLAVQFPFPGITALRGDIAHQDARVAAERLQTVRRTVLTTAAKAFWELLYAYKAHDLAEQSNTMAASLKDTLAARYAVGQADMALLVRVNQEYSRVQEQVPIQLGLRRSKEAPLRELLALPAGAAIGPPAVATPDTMLPDLDTLQTLAGERRQELRALRAEVGRAELMLELAETGLYPGFSLNLSLPERNEVRQAAGENARPDAFAVSTRASAGAGQPLSSSYGIQSAYLSEARQNLTALRQQLHAAEAATPRLVHEAWFKLDQAAREERVARETLVPLAVTDRDTASAGYAAGIQPYADFVDAVNRWFAARLNRERLRAEAGIARAELEEAVGVSLLTPKD